MLLTPTQIQIANDRHRFRVICCGRRWGKTTLAIEEIKGCALGKKARIAYIAPTYQQARDIAWEMLKKELGPIILQNNESRLELKVKSLKGESLIILRGWEAIETLRGQRFDLIILDEIASMRNWLSAWSEVVRPTLTDSRGEAIFISTPKGFNHFYDLYNLGAKDLDYRSFHFTSYDNPHLPVDELNKAKEELTEDRFAQEYLADFRKTEGLVYKEFDRQKHIYTNEQIPNPVETVAGIDFGYTNPCAVLTVTRDYENNWWVEKEWYKTGKSEDEQTEYIISQNFNKVYPDPENPMAIESLRKKGANVRDVVKGKDSIKTGIQLIRNLLKNNKLKIHQNCENLIFELETYSYDENKDKRNPPEIPIPENNHALDALRYIFLMQGNSTSNQVKQFYPTMSHYGVRYPRKI